MILSAYKSCQFTVTNWEHADVATLSFGFPARVAEMDSRFKLFEAMGFETENGFFLPDPEKIETRHQEVVDWITGDFASALGKAGPRK